METHGVPFLVKLLQRSMLLQSGLNIARAVPIFVFEFYPQMICVFICLFALSVGKHGMRTFGIKALSIYWISMIVACFCDVIAWLIGYVELKRGYSSSEYAWGSFWTYTALLIFLIIVNVVGLVTAIKLINRMKNFTLQERLVFLHMQAGDMKSDSSSATDGPAFRTIAVRPSCCVVQVPENAAAVSSAPVAEVEMSAPVVVSHDSTVETQSNLDQAILKFDSGVFVENAVHKAKYNFVTFLPLFLYNQFSRLANLYTLGVVCLCFFSFSPLSPAASLLPLLIVLVTSAIREIFEDHKRKMQDRDVNMRQTEALRPESVSESVGVFRKQVCQFQTCCWQDLKVGDIVRIHRDQYFPSDLVLLSCSTDTGRCYVETSQLDGESNFKLRFALKDTAALTDAQSLCDYQYEVQCERPNSNLYVFDGTLKLTQLSTLQTSNIPISSEQMLLRGTKLKHNEWCIGLVINTGLDTKIEQNSTATPHKESRMERGINTKFVFIFLLQTALCLTCSLGYNKFRLRFSSNGPALPIYLRATEDEDDSNQFIYGSYVILFNSMIPLSMYVTMEVVRFFNAQLIANHPRMRVLKSVPGSSDVSSSEGPIKEDDMYITSQSRNTSVVEELGQIRYIFSDKTGTLTRNQMILAQCSVAGVMFGSPVVNDIEPNVPPVSEQTTVEIDKQPSTRSVKFSGKSSSDTSTASKPRLSRGVSMFEDADSAGVFMKHFSGLNDDDDAEGDEELDFEGGGNDQRSSNEFCDQRLVDMAQYNSKADNEMTVDDVKEYQAAALVAREFLLSLALCNTVVPSKGQRDNEIVYQAGSPDEAALVEGARRLNVILKSRQDTRVTISFLDSIECYDVLGLFEFTSDRKRMSVILRGPFAADALPDVINAAPVRLYCKGADNIILKRLSDENPLPCTCSELVQQHLGDMSSSGLRTLCFAARTLSNEEATKFSREFHEASMSLTHRRDMLEKVAEQYECDLEFIGITAIEDRLQEHVPYCLQKLREAGIKVCVCTGDKLETAVSIGYSSGLLLPHFELVRIEATDPAGMDQALNGIIERYRIQFNSNPTLWDQLRAFYTSDTELDRNAYSALPTTPFAIVIDGPSLSLALQAEHSDKFLSVLRAAVSAICCRCSPLQKASVVDLVKKAGVAMDDDFITLAVGDGANDCPMILKAHVGVGISDGKEGMAAVLASDFSIPRFAMLTRLLLVHGSHTYSRMSKLILFSFAKNIALALPNFWFAFVNGYSGQSLYWDFLFTWFNAVFTTAPIMTLAFTDEHASDRALLRFPGLYKNGMNNQSFGWPNFLGWLLVGTWVSMCVYAFGLWIPQVAEVGPSGHTGGIWFAGVTGYGVLIFALTIQVSLFTATRNRFRKANLLALIASPIIFFGFVSIYSALTTLYPDSAFIAYQLFTIPAFWLVLPVGTITALLPNATLKTIKHLWFPKAHHILNQVMLAHNDMTHAMESAYKEQQRSRMRRMPSGQNLGVNRQLSRRLTRMGSSFALHNVAEHDAEIGEEIVPVAVSVTSSKSSKRASSPVPEIAVAAAAAAESRDYVHADEHEGSQTKPELIRDATRARIDIESWAGGVHALDDHHAVAPPNMVRTFSLMHRDTMSGFAFSQESGHGVLVNDRNRDAALKRRATRQAARANETSHPQ